MFGHSFGPSFDPSFGPSFSPSFGPSFDPSVIHITLHALLSLKSTENAFPSLEKTFIDSFAKHATALYHDSPEQFVSIWKDKCMYELALACSVDNIIDHIIDENSERLFHEKTIK